MESPVAPPETKPDSRPPLAISEMIGLALTVVLALFLSLRPFAEPDLWLHRRAGAHISESGQLVGPDPWAQFATAPYMATQWLPEVAASLVFDAFGTGGMLWLRSSIVVLIALVVFDLSRRESGPGAAAFATIACLLASTPSLNPRPQLLSFLFFAVTVAAWRSTARDRRPRWWLVPLHWVWACSHGLWMFGIAIAALTLLALLLQRQGRPSRHETLRLAGLIAACTAAVAVTPLGPQLLLAPFRVADNASWVADEWQRTPLGIPASIVGLTMLVATVGLWLARRSVPSLWEMSHLAFAACLFLWMWRLVPLAVILAAPLLASAVSTRATRARHGTPRRRIAGVAAVTALFGATVVSLGPAGETASRYPADMRAVDAALDCLDAGDVVFNDFGLSGWLLWRHPELAPVADLRAEIYPRGHLQRYIDAEEHGIEVQRFINDTGAAVALLEPKDPLVESVSHTLGWETIAASPGGVLLAAPTQANDCPH